MFAVVSTSVCTMVGAVVGVSCLFGVSVVAIRLSA